MKNELSESQCGFRKGRLCIDMTFAVHQPVEKLWEHKGKCTFYFIDLRRAYDSVPRAVLWLVLLTSGVTIKMIELIHSVHHGMKAKTDFDGELLDEICAENS